MAMGDGKERGLMVISTTGKTKARQRKGAIANWKVTSAEHLCICYSVTDSFMLYWQKIIE